MILESHLYVLCWEHPFDYWCHFYWSYTTDHPRSLATVTPKTLSISRHLISPKQNSSHSPQYIICLLLVRQVGKFCFLRTMRQLHGRNKNVYRTPCVSDTRREISKFVSCRNHLTVKYCQLEWTSLWPPFLAIDWMHNNHMLPNVWCRSCRWLFEPIAQQIRHSDADPTDQTSPKTCIPVSDKNWEIQCTDSPCLP